MLPKENFNFLEYWLNGKGLAYLERYAGDDRAREIVESCYDIVPGLKLVGLNRNRDGILYSFSKKKAVLPIEYLSDGQRILLAMVLDLLLRCEVLNYRAYRRNVFNNTDGVVLIDEIDMHLHPKWQREVIGNLKKFFPKVQFIITTHSPFVIQSLGEGELIAFSSDMSEISRNVGGLSLEEIAEEIQGVPMAHLSKKKMEMLSAAEDVFNRLKEYKHRELPLNLRRQIAQELIAKIAPYSDDVAYFAYLKTNIKDFLNTYENS